MTSPIKENSDLKSLYYECRSILEATQNRYESYRKYFSSAHPLQTNPQTEVAREIDNLGQHILRLRAVERILERNIYNHMFWSPNENEPSFMNLFNEVGVFLRTTPSMDYVNQNIDLTLSLIRADLNRITNTAIEDITFLDIKILEVIRRDLIKCSIYAEQDSESQNLITEHLNKAVKKYESIHCAISVVLEDVENSNFPNSENNIGIQQFSLSLGKGGLKSEDDETSQSRRARLTTYTSRQSESGSISPTPNTSPHTVCGTILLEADGFYSYREGYGAMSYEQYLLDLGTNGVSKPQAQPATFNISNEKSWLNYLADKVWLVALPTSVATGEAATAGGAGAFVAKSAPALKNFAMRSSPYAIGAGVVLYMANEALDHAYHPGIENMNYTVSNEYYNQQVLGYNLNGQDYEINTNPLMNELGYQNHQFDLNSAMGHGSHDTMQDMVLVTYDKSDYTKEDIRKIYNRMGITLSDG